MMSRHVLAMAPLLGILACGSPFEIPDIADVGPGGVAVGHEHTCSISPTGTAHCWGWGELGQLGDGALATARTPRLVHGNLRLGRIDAGSFHTCGLVTTGEAFCWGSRHAGELGDGEILGEVGEPSPVQGGHRFRAIAVGDGHTCAINYSGKAFCWGLGGTGQLGNGDLDNRTGPTPVSGGIRFQRISAGFHVTCGVSTAGKGYCWGDNQWGMLGSGVVGGVSEEPVAIVGDLDLEAIAVGSFVTCGLGTDRAAYCWGSGSFGRLGTGDGSEATEPVPQLVAGGIPFTSLSVGDTHTCGLAADGTAYCWGLNTYGKLGSAVGASSGVPAPVNGGHTFLAIGAGTFHTCGVTSQQEAFCWGHNVVGQLGVPGINDRTTEPVLVIYPPLLRDEGPNHQLR